MSQRCSLQSSHERMYPVHNFWLISLCVIYHQHLKNPRLSCRGPHLLNSGPMQSGESWTPRVGPLSSQTYLPLFPSLRTASCIHWGQLLRMMVPSVLTVECSRSQLPLVTCCCVTNDPTLSWLQIATSFYSCYCGPGIWEGLSWAVLLLHVFSAGGEARIWQLGVLPSGFSLPRDICSVWLGLVTAWWSEDCPPSYMVAGFQE